MKSQPGSGKKQERNFEIVVNHITTNRPGSPDSQAELRILGFGIRVIREFSLPMQ